MKDLDFDIKEDSSKVNTQIIKETIEEEQAQITQLSVLNKKGIANTELITCEYQFMADNEIDAKTDYGCNSVGTKTITSLPSNTIAMAIWIDIIRNTNYSTNIIFKRKTTDTMIFEIRGSGNDVDVANKYMRLMIWLPTNGNQFHIAAINTTIEKFVIVGYKVKGA